MRALINKTKYLVEENYIIILIILFAFVVRIWGIYFDYPGVRYIHDETYHISYIVKAMAERTFYPDVILQYPFFLTFLYFPAVVLKILYIMIREGIYNVAELKAFMIIDGMGQLLVLTRWYSVFFGTAAVYAIYKIAEIVWQNKFVAYYVSLAGAFSLVPVFLSHWGRAHSAMMLFLLLSLFFILKFEKQKNLKYFYLSNLAAALAFSAHYLGLNAFIFPLAGWLMNRRRIKAKVIAHNLLIYIACFLLFYILNFSGVSWMIKENLTNYYGQSGSASLVSVGFYERFYYIFRDSFWVAPIMAALSIFWLVKVKEYWRNKLTRYLLLGILFNYLVMISIVASPHMSRWLVIFITYITILGAGQATFFAIKQNKKSLIIILLALVLAPGIYLSGKYSFLLNHNTIIEAQEWIKNNINKEDKIYSFDYDVELPLSVSAAAWQTNENQVNSSKNKYITENSDRFRNYGYNLYYDFGHNKFDALAGVNTDYILISYSKEQDKFEILKNLTQYHELDLVQTFRPTESQYLFVNGVGDIINNPTNFYNIISLKKSGPFVEIYRILN